MFGLKDKVDKVLDLAGKLTHKYPLAKGAMGRDDKGKATLIGQCTSFCSMGYIYRAVHDLGYNYEYAEKAIARASKRAHIGSMAIFNDRPETTIEDVREKFFPNAK